MSSTPGTTMEERPAVLDHDSGFSSLTLTDNSSNSNSTSRNLAGFAMKSVPLQPSVVPTGVEPPNPENIGEIFGNVRTLDKNNNGGRGAVAAANAATMDTQSESQQQGKSTTTATATTADQNSAAEKSTTFPDDDSGETFITCPKEQGPGRCGIVTHETFLVDVIVSNAVSPLNFAIRSYRESNLLKMLEAEMSESYNNFEEQKTHSPLQFKDLILDGYYAVKYPGENKSGLPGVGPEPERWVRCQIKKPFSENLPLLTHLVDHGCYYSTEPNCIRPLRKKYCKMPCQSFDAKLHFVESTKSAFTPEDCHRFHKQVEGKPFCAIVLRNVDSPDENKMTVILVDTSSEKDHYVHHDYSSSKKSTPTSANGRK